MPEKKYKTVFGYTTPHFKIEPRKRYWRVSNRRSNYLSVSGSKQLEELFDLRYKVIVE